MEPIDLHTLASEKIRAAERSSNGRSSETLFGGHDHSLRHTMIAMLGGYELSEHESPGDATLQVLSGHIELRSEAETTVGTIGELLIVPPQRHSVYAVEDAVIILTVAKTLT